MGRFWADTNVSMGPGAGCSDPTILQASHWVKHLPNICYAFRSVNYFYFKQNVQNNGLRLDVIRGIIQFCAF